MGKLIAHSLLDYEFQHIRQVVESAMHLLRMDGAAFRMPRSDGSGGNIEGFSKVLLIKQHQKEALRILKVR